MDIAMKSLTVAAWLLLLWVCHSPAKAQLVEVTPQTLNETAILNQEADFARTCEVKGDTSTLVTLRWVQNGTNTIKTDDSATFLSLVITIANFDMSGQYTCEAVFSDSSNPIKVEAGFLNVYDPSVISVPRKQFVQLNHDIGIQCTADIPDVTYTYFDPMGIELASEHIPNANFTHEGEYICRIQRINEHYIEAFPIAIYVVVMPEIRSMPETATVIGNRNVEFGVGFVSWPNKTTVVTWYHNGVSLVDPSSRVTTDFGDFGLNAWTNLTFAPIMRAHTGMWRVVIENNVAPFPLDISRVENSFQINVKVLPSLPKNIVVTKLNSTTVRVTWEPTNQVADTSADRFILALTPVTNETAITDSYSLSGVVTDAYISVHPGQEYRLQLTASNVDGETKSNLNSFTTDPDFPKVLNATTERLNYTAYQITVTVAYTGGGPITQFAVSFRVPDTGTVNSLGTTIPAFRVPNSNSSQWRVVVTSPDFANLTQVEFLVSVSNAQALITQLPAPVLEALIVPGAPHSAVLVSSSTNSLVINLSLSEEGGNPILRVVLNVTSPEEEQQLEVIEGPFFTGDPVQFELSGLQPRTEYLVDVYAENLAGRGQSVEVAFTTASPVVLPSWLIIVVAVCAGVALVLVVVGVVSLVLLCYKCKRSGDQKKYYAGSGVGVYGGDHTQPENTLDPSHEILHHQKRGFTSLSTGPLTPRSPTLAPTPLPGISAMSDSSSPLTKRSKFKFDTNESISDVSGDGGSVRYTTMTSSIGESMYSPPFKSSAITDVSYPDLTDLDLPSPHAPATYVNYATDV